jgi:glutamyl-Q tRNA(Asp) synthetase
MPEEKTPSPVFRFAPSPNGELHLGHAYSALVNDHLARQLQGRFLLRIEDVDGGRARDEFERQIYEDLEWLGIEWEKPVWKQSEHLDNYTKALKKLQYMDLLYPCFASRREIADHPSTQTMPENPDGFPIYPGLYRDFPEHLAAKRIAKGDPHTLRLNMKKALEAAQDKLAVHKRETISFRERQSDGRYKTVFESPAIWGDVVLARKEIPTSYTLAVIIDDALQGVTHVTRGEDLYFATSLQRLLQILLDLPEPLYFHHPLIVDMTGRKLSKSARDVSLKAIRATGISSQELRLQLPPLIF